jgi:hypothetical protein
MTTSVWDDERASGFEAQPLLRIRYGSFQNLRFDHHMFAKGHMRGGVNSTALSGQVPKAFNYPSLPKLARR